MKWVEHHEVNQGKNTRYLVELVELTKWWVGNGIFNAYFVRLGRDINKTELFHLIHRFTLRQLQYLVRCLIYQACGIHFHLASKGHCTNIYNIWLSSSRTLLADDATPVSSPLTPLLTSSTSSTEAEKAITKPSKVQAVLKGIKQVEFLVLSSSPY
ncbi:hypothetical protein KY284_016146 [Solanum tuberosum]|nr:hypothetical protein KY284_016146 [Solanum tuberosum]